MNLQKRGEVEKLQIIMPRDQEEEQTQKKQLRGERDKTNTAGSKRPGAQHLTSHGKARGPQDCQRCWQQWDRARAQ